MVSSSNLRRTGQAVVGLNAILVFVLFIVAMVLMARKECHNLQADHLNVKEDVLQTLQKLRKDDGDTDLRRVQDDLHELYKKNGNLNKPAAHLVISRATNTTEKVPVLRWLDDSDITFKSGGVDYKDGMIKIPHGGYYSIYSNILYQGNGTRELSYGRIIHTVIRQNGGKEMILLQNLQSTPSIRRGRQAYVSSNLGATFYLEEGSSVYVSSSIPENINLSPTTTYFGLFLS